MKRITNYDRWYNKAVIYSSICLKHWVLIKGQVFFSPLFSWFLRLSSRLRKIIWFHDMCMLVGSKFITVNLLNWLAKITASEKSFYRGKKSNVSKKEYLLGLCLSQLHLQYRRHAKQPRFFHMRKKCNIFTHNGILFSNKNIMKYFHLQKKGWIWRTSRQVKRASDTKRKAEFSPSIHGIQVTKTTKTSASRTPLEQRTLFMRNRKEWER